MPKKSKPTAQRLPELDLLRALALFLLFVFHSAFNVIYPQPLWFMQMYFLGAFFIVSGFLFGKSLEKYNTFDLIKNKIIKLYVPFVLILFLFYIINFFPGADPLSFIYHASGLSIFYLLQAGSLNLFHLWFVVHLFVYFMLFLFLGRVVKSERIKAIILTVFFVFLAYLSSSESVFRLEWKFLFFLPIFYAGLLLSKRNRLQQTYNILQNKLSVIFLILAAIAGTANMPFIASGNPVLQDMINSILFMIGRVVFVLAACVISLWIFHKANFAGKIQSAAFHISKGSLITYMIQPIFSAVLFSIMNTIFFSYQAACPICIILIGIITSFVVVVVASHMLRKLYEKLR
jgi:peptidoglycan/LPS O-acetylase OafA/YrhL